MFNINTSDHGGKFGNEITNGTEISIGKFGFKEMPYVYMISNYFPVNDPRLFSYDEQNKILYVAYDWGITKRFERYLFDEETNAFKLLTTFSVTLDYSIRFLLFLGDTFFLGRIEAQIEFTKVVLQQKLWFLLVLAL